MELSNILFKIVQENNRRIQIRQLRNCGKIKKYLKQRRDFRTEQTDYRTLSFLDSRNAEIQQEITERINKQKEKENVLIQNRINKEINNRNETERIINELLHKQQNNC